MTSKAQQIELDNALIAPENHHVISKCNMRINPGMKPKEPTYQVPGKAFDEPPTKEEALSFIYKLGHIGEIKYITDFIVDHHTNCGEPLHPSSTSVSVARKDVLYKIHKDKKVTTTKPKLTKKKAPVKADRGKGLNVLFDVALSEAAQLKEATKRSKKDFHISQASGSGDGTDFKSGVSNEQHRKTSGTDEGTGTIPGVPNLPKYDSESEKESWADSGENDDDDEINSKDESDNGDDDDDDGDGTDFESGVPDEQHRKTSSTDEGTGTKPRVPDVPKYDSESKKESWVDSGEEDHDDENDSEDENDDDGNDNNDDGDDDDDANHDDNLEDDHTNDDDEETDSDRTESDRIKIYVLNQSSTEYYKGEEEKFDDEEKIDDEEKMDEEEDDEVTKELYKDVNVNLGNEDIDMTNVDHGGPGQQNVSQESGFEQVEEDAHVTLTPVLDTQKTDEPVQSSSVSSDFTSKLLNLENPSPANNEIASLMDTIARHATTVPEITSFNDRVTNLEKDLSEIKQVDQYAQDLSSIPAIVDRYIDNKLGEAIQKAIVAHNLDCREEAQAENRDYIELVDTSMRTILKEEVNTQLPQILPQAVLDFAIPSTYEAATSLSEFDLTKILIDKMEKNKSYDKADYKRQLYDALVKSYQTDKDLFDIYGEVFTLKRSQDDRDKDQDPSAGSDRGTTRRKSSKETKSSIDSRSKEKKSSSTSKDASQSQHKPSGKSAHAEEPSHTVDDSGVQQDQEFNTGNNDEQPADKEVSKTWISQVARAKEPRTLFDELMDTSFNFSAFVLNRLNIKDLTQEILVGPAFELLKGTCKSLRELEY
ncbi:hypothetical protein Tco_0505909 [Tanacetum coccineum]